MSKRFGRNQRRKMRQEIESLRLSQDHAVQHARDVQQQYNHLVRRLSMWSDEIRRILRDDSVFNERIAVRHSDTDLHMMRLSHVSGVVPSFRPEAVSLDIENVIEAFIWRINIEPDKYSHMVRIELHNRYDQPTALALSADHIWHERDVEPVARMIAQKLVDFKAGSKRTTHD